MFRSLIAAGLIAVSGAAQADVSNYVVDPAHTWVTWEAQHFGTSTLRGRFDKKAGQVTLDRAARTGHAEIVIDTTSISTGTAQFDNHLKSKDFFNVAEAPTAKFVGDKFVFDGDKVTEVSGTLTIMGKTRAVTLKASKFNCFDHPMLKREVCGGDFETAIARSQFGLNYGLPAVAPDSIRLLIQIEAVKQ